MYAFTVGGKAVVGETVWMGTWKNYPAVINQFAGGAHMWVYGGQGWYLAIRSDVGLIDFEHLEGMVPPLHP